VSRRGQARWLSAAYKIARRARYVAGLGCWKLLDDPPGPTSAPAGLLTFDGSERKPSYGAYKRAR